ncbi:MAG: 50S ribosomal protein L17 [Chitinophagales bacterium]|nr:50S ribosomal protein L17 [Chitinophagales bacterium]
MRHARKVNHLGRDTQHRRALLRNLASSLILNKHIITTTAKAKALRRFVEPLLTRAKEDTTHNRRVVFSVLRQKEAVKTLFGEVAEKIASRPGGYTRIIKIGPRSGDSAELALIELVDFSLSSGSAEQTAAAAKPVAKKRTRRGGKKGGTRTAAASVKEKPKAAERAAGVPKTMPQKTGGS